MELKLSALAGLILALLLISGCINTGNNGNSSGEKVKVIVQVFEERNKLFEDQVEVQKGATGLEATELLVDVDYQQTSMGAFVKSILGITPESDEYWALYVDGKYSEKGISQVVIEKDITITWKLEMIDFSKFS